METLLRLWKGRHFSEEKEGYYRKKIGFWEFVEPDWVDPFDTAKTFEKLRDSR